MHSPLASIQEPYLGRGQGEECRKGFSGLVVSGRNATELFDVVEHPLDAVSILVSAEIAGGRVLPVGLRWNDRLGPVNQVFSAQESPS
jgi:hypothetical protein